ncbi:hypothetical protein HYPSUDRAFT_38092 [Hypholoma sublateritium FD-334 SS-4]|uniref:Uncharacterized protein n=1 Tax=Hypholoma sublateritium (strain FD-334 SS-4) TaxID=945553 RepID=A0A0D2LCV6_HYPSF|nr:hypothetical protein HYPSUDRAFT_38092 [Hypholoma sublateritium FD-334 SS-4]
MDKINTDERTGTENMPGNFPLDDDDSTSSGGYGASPEQVWSAKAQRGVHLPAGNGYPSSKESDSGLIDQATDGTNLKEELQDAEQGRDKESFQREDEWASGKDKDV